MSTDQNVIDAAEAEQILRHRLVKGFFDEADKRFLAALVTVDPKDKEAQQDLLMRAHWLGQFRRWFEAYIQNGKLTEAKFEQPKLKRLFAHMRGE